jgi:hypothetical protein
MAGYVLSPDGYVAGCRALSSLPFAEAAQPWVERYFPHAEYVRDDAADRIAVLDVSRPGVLALQAAKGMGKSKAIRAAVAALPPATSVVQITFRRSLAWSSHGMLGEGASLYSEIGDGGSGVISARLHKRLTIVVNSLARVRGTYDVVVIDELVSVLDMISGPLLSPDARVNVVYTLGHLLTHARTVVVADAMLDAACLHFVLLARVGRKLDPLVFLDYTRRLHGDYVYYPHASVDTWMVELACALAAGKRVVVPCMTKSMAARVTREFSKIVPTICYTADGDPAVLHAHMADIHKHWADAQLLVYSPVITAGCSFELPHYDLVFFYGHTGLGSVRSAVQMIARVRDVADRKVHVCIGGEGASCMAALPSIEDDSWASSGAAPAAAAADDVFMALLRVLQRFREQERAAAADAFPYYFWTLVVHSGAKIGYLRELKKGAILPPPAGAGVGAPASAATTSTSGPESWLLHDWDSAVTSTLLPANPTFLQRAGVMHPYAAIAAGLMPDVPDVRLLRGKSAISMPPWTTKDTKARVRAWTRLLFLRAITKANGVVVATGSSATLPLPDQTVLLYPPPALIAARKFVSDDVRDACAPFIRRFLAPGRPSISADDAWVLAGMETCARNGTPVTEDVPTPCPPASNEFAVRVTSAAHALAYRMVAAAVNVPFTAGPVTADLVLMDRDGAAHVVTVRTSGRAATHGLQDVLKTAAIAAVAPFPVATVRVVYVLEDEVLTADVTEAQTLALRLAITSAASPLPAPGIRPAVVWGAPPDADRDTIDLRAVFAYYLGQPLDTPLDVNDARVLAHSGPVPDLEDLWRACVVDGYVVFFWNGRPWAVIARVPPPLRFL